MIIAVFPRFLATRKDFLVSGSGKSCFGEVKTKLLSLLPHLAILAVMSLVPDKQGFQLVLVTASARWIDFVLLVMYSVGL